MISKLVRERKTFRDSEGFIGKSMSCTPTFLGYFILKQNGYFNRDLADSKPLSIKEDEKEVYCYAY